MSSYELRMAMSLGQQNRHDTLADSLTLFPQKTIQIKHVMRPPQGPVIVNRLTNIFNGYLRRQMKVLWQSQQTDYRTDNHIMQQYINFYRTVESTKYICGRKLPTWALVI
jgi:hypothetical protein